MNVATAAVNAPRSVRAITVTAAATTAPRDNVGSGAPRRVRGDGGAYWGFAARSSPAPMLREGSAGEDMPATR